MGIGLDKNTFSVYRMRLEAEERSAATVEKYMAALRRLTEFCGPEVTDKAQLLDFKAALAASGMAPATVNGVISAVNKLLDIYGYREWWLKFLRVQRRAFQDPGRELHAFEYEKLVNTASKAGDERFSLLLQTICATGARVSELAYITAEACRAGKAEIANKGKIRTILLPKKLCKALLSYCKKRRIAAGPVFITATGRPMDRSNIWRKMKALAKKAGVALSKVFPHNLRHLFARTYYKKYRDIVRLADILGHSSVETTRIYTAQSAAEQRRQMDGLRLLL